MSNQNDVGTLCSFLLSVLSAPQRSLKTLDIVHIVTWFGQRVFVHVSIRSVPWLLHIANVSSILGKNVYDIQTSVETYEDSIFTWNKDGEVKVTILPQHNLRDKEYVTISGFSSSLSELNKNFQKSSSFCFFDPHAKS